MNFSSDSLPIGTMLKLNPEGVPEYIDFMARTGMECCQLCRLSDAYMSGGEENPESRQLLAELQKHSIRPVSIFLFYKNRKEGNGLVTPELRAERFAYAFRQMLWGGRHGVKYISCHAGVFPEPSDAAYERFVTDMKELARFAADLDEYFLFETGPETVEALEEILRDIGEENVGINFDPANLLLYDKTDPAVFAERLFPKIHLVHCKDGRRPVNGEKFGRQTPLGQGDTGFVRLLGSLIDRGFRGPLILEREIPVGEEHFADQKTAFEQLKNIREKHTEK